MKETLSAILWIVIVCQALGCTQPQSDSFTTKDVFASDTSLVWSYPYEDDTLYRLWSIEFGNKGVIEDGLYTIYLDESKTQRVYNGTVLNNKKVGTHTYWRTDGSKWREGEYNKGELNGFYRSWYPDGSEKSISEYLDGVILNRIETYSIDSLGLINRTTEYLNGTRLRELVTDERGKIIEEVYFKFNTVDGNSQEYLTITFDSMGFVSNAYRYELDTVFGEFEAGGFKEVWMKVIDIDYLVNKNKSIR